MTGEAIPVHSVIETVELAPGYVISRVAKGNWQLAERHGAPFDPDVAVDDMRRFVEAGITAFDCADHYVGVEELIGRFRRRYPELARRLRVSTKYTPDLATLSTLSREAVVETIDLSLRRLGLEQLDLVQFHWWDYQVPGCVQALTWLKELQTAGKIAHLGTTNFDVAHLKAITSAGIRLLTHQLQYSLLDNRPDRGMVQFCRDHGIHLLCYGTVAGGFLSDRWLGVSDPPQPYANRSLVKYRLMVEEYGGWERFQSLLEIARRVADRHRTSIATVCTRWVLDKPQVVVALVGARDARHLESTLDIFRIRLDARDRDDLDRAAAAALGPPGDCYGVERDPASIHKRIMQMNQNTHGAPAAVDLAPRLDELRG
ncbi:MAG: aldo/keto reductase [Betaproteobacteria bacterium]|nr:aldo/keto reductase [Betaproteobacteria bacterium]